MRKTTFNTGLFLFAIALISPWLASHDAQAAGLGKLTVNSAMGQPFKAEIDLVAVKKEETSSLVAKIASRDAFRQANVDYSVLLASFKVSVETRADGQPYVKITSSRPVADPFVSMLVELTWSSGRLLREYTVLLDPIETEVPRLAAPKTQAAPAPMQAPAAQPVPQAAAPAPARDVAVEPKVEAPAPAPAPAPAAREVAVAEKSGAAGATYGPVKRGDTLAKIAREVAPQGVNLDQMLIALQRANRDAFSGNNINRLKTGPILRVPDSSEIATIEPAEAKKEVKVQAADWNSYRQKLAALAGAAPVAAEAAKQEASGKITTTVQDKAVADKEASRDVLKLSKGEEPGSAGGKDSKDAKAMKARIQAMEEDATAKSKALKEANERVGMLEKNVAEMQRLLELKNAAIAEAQKQALAAAKPSAAPVVVTPPAASAAAPVATTPAEPVKSDATAPTSPEAVAEVKPEDAAVVAGASAVEAVEPAKPVTEAKPAAPVAVSPPPVAEPSLLDELMNYIEYVVGALLLLAGAGGFVFWKKKQSAKSGGVMAPVAAQQAQEAVSVASSAGTEAVAQTDEVNPVAEAEVYLAYGRDTQAEEILKEALAKNPANAECLAKLLEVHVMRKDKKSFETTALALQAVAPEGPLWERAIGLGIGIDPTNPLYGGAVAVDINEHSAAAPDFSLDAGSESNVAPDVDFDLGGTTTTPVADPEATMLAEPEPDYGLKFGAKDGTEDVEATMVMSLPGPITAADEPAAPPPVAGLEGALMFDLGAPAASAPAEAPAATAAPDEDMGMAFSIDFPSSSESAPAPAKSAPEPEADLAAINFNMNDMLSSTPADAGSGAVEKDAHWHEISTKFDLAKAYQEMGDNDGAKEILQEVIREGDAQQQEDAKAMLASL